MKKEYLHWFQTGPHPVSAAEAVIRDILLKYPVEFYMEVSFKDLMTSDYGYARFDFFLPALLLVIEYDGELWHNSPISKERDKVKEEFCTTNGLTVVRYNKKHFYKLEEQIAYLLKKYQIRKNK